MADIRVGTSTIAGRGVFATRDFAPGDLIEECPVIRLPQPQLEAIRETVLWDYIFGFEDGSGDFAVALGFGSLYNHSDDANADYMKNSASNTITITARRRISAGDEITLGYERPWLMRNRG